MPLMTSTLPTIIGAGVVSRAVDTTFGRHERGTPRRKPAKRAPKGTKVAKGRKVYKGARGGKYILRKGRRVYI